MKYTIEDLTDHDSVGAIILDKYNRLLMFDHVKFKFWTIPIGKVKLNQDIETGIKEEVKEETDLDILSLKKVISFKKIWTIGGKKVKVFNHLFEVYDYKGIPKNLEIEKHNDMKFMTIYEINNIERISTLTKESLKYLKLKT